MRPAARPLQIAATLFFAAAALFGLAGCQEDPSARDSQQLPWGRTAAWEHQGPTGGQAPKF